MSPKKVNPQPTRAADLGLKKPTSEEILSEGLQLLPPRRKTRPSTTATTPQSESGTPQPVAASSPAGAAGERDSETAPIPAPAAKGKVALPSAAGQSPLSVKVEREIKDKIDLLRAMWKMSAREVVFIALNHDDATTKDLVEQWQQRIADYQASQQNYVMPGFLVPEQKRVRERRDEVTMSIRMTQANQRAIAQRARQVGARGKGQLIEACVAALTPESLRTPQDS